MGTTQTGVNGRNVTPNVAMDSRLAGDRVQTLLLQVVDRIAPSMDPTLNRKLALRNPAEVRYIEIFKGNLKVLGRLTAFQNDYDDC